MAEGSGGTGAGLRLARLARGLSQQQLALVAGVSRQAVSAVESGHSDPSLRVALALARALGAGVEELFGPGEPAVPVTAVAVGPVAVAGERVALAPVGGRFVALPLRGDPGAGLGFLPAGGLAVASEPGPGLVSVRPVGPSRPTLVVAGCDPALPLLATPLGLLDPPVGFAWWPCGSEQALSLAGQGLVLRPELRSVVTGLDAVAARGLRIVNREPGAEARRLLDAECARLGLDPASLPGYGTRVGGHLQVAAAVSAGLADAGIASEPAARAYGLGFVPLADEHFSLVIPAPHAASREVAGLLKVLSSPWLLAQLASLPGYDTTSCGDRLA